MLNGIMWVLRSGAPLARPAGALWALYHLLQPLQSLAQEGHLGSSDGSLGGRAGLHAHIRHVNKFAECDEELREIKRDMVDVFNQKLDLGLIDCGKSLKSFSDEKPLLLLALTPTASSSGEVSGRSGRRPRRSGRGERQTRIQAAPPRCSGGRAGRRAGCRPHSRAPLAATGPQCPSRLGR